MLHGYSCLNSRALACASASIKVYFILGQEFAESFEAMMGAFRAMELSEAIGKVRGG